MMSLKSFMVCAVPRTEYRMLHGIDSWIRISANLLKRDAGPSNLCLRERVVVPFATSIDNPSYGAAYSPILFGPPGTAKTTICEALAQRMGYELCVIDTAAFLADDLTNVSARIRYVFSRLMALRKCVNLFDEIEEFALDRETPGLSMESRMPMTCDETINLSFSSLQTD
jgi:hypothetical protein